VVVLDGGEQSRLPVAGAWETLASSSLRQRQRCTTWRWKLRWHPHAEQRSAPPVPSSPAARNSRHPSTAWPPIHAAWFRQHSPYRTPQHPPSSAGGGAWHRLGITSLFILNYLLIPSELKG
jgi:hypothetical protein